MTGILHDLRYALRQLRKNPGFAATAILTLGLGIGINAAMFTVVNAVLLRPLAFPHPNQIVELSERSKGDSDAMKIASLPNVRDWQTQSQTMQSIAYWSIKFHSFEANGVSDFLPDYITSANFFSTLGVQPVIGRTFLADEGTLAKNKVVVLSYSAWQQYFHGDAGALGKPLKLGTEFYTIIGVMPPSFNFPNSGSGAVVWSPLAPGKDYEDRDSRSIQVFGRMRPGVTVAQAQAELSTIQSRLAQQYKEKAKEISDRASVQDYRESMTAGVHSALTGLLFAVLVVWLIACANVAGLMLTRAAGRRREMAIRTAVGAGKARLVRQLMTESLVIGFISSLLGLGLATLCLKVMWVYLGEYLPLAYTIHVDGRVLAALAGLSVLSALIFGTAPALRAATQPAQEGLRDGTTSVGTSRRQRLVLNGIVAGEIAMSLVLLISAGLLLRSLYKLHQVPLGFSPEHIVTTSIFLPQDKYAGKDVARIFDQPLLDRLQHLPGVESAALSTVLPLSPNFTTAGSFDVIGRAKDTEHPVSAAISAVSPNFFHTLGIPLVAGRGFQPSDTPDAQMSVVVSQAFVHAYFPNEDPIGKQLKMDDKGQHQIGVIIGVVGNTHAKTQAEATAPQVYISYLQLTEKDPTTPFILGFFSQIAVRTRNEPTAIMPSLRKVLREADPDLTVNDVQTMTEKVEESMGKQTLIARLLWLFAGTALLISIAGIYGSLAYQVSQRTRDIGLRMAFGASRSEVVAMILRQSVAVVCAGVGAGVLAALLAGRALSSFLFGVSAHDILTISVVSLILTVFALVASYVPARRASRIDPIEALRYE